MKPIKPRERLVQSVYILKVFSALVVTAVAMFAGTSIGDTQGQSVVELTGIVTDTACGIQHGTKIGGNAECTRLCVKMGAEYALGVGKRVYILQGHQAELDRFAGDRVIVKGRMIGRGTMAVEWVVPLPVSAFRAGMNARVEEASENSDIATQGMSAAGLFRN